MPARIPLPWYGQRLSLILLSFAVPQRNCSDPTTKYMPTVCPLRSVVDRNKHFAFSFYCRLTHQYPAAAHARNQTVSVHYCD